MEPDKPTPTNTPPVNDGQPPNSGQPLNPGESVYSANPTPVSSVGPQAGPLSNPESVFSDPNVPSSTTPSPTANADMPLYVPEEPKNNDDKKRKRILIVLGVLMGLLFISIIAAILLSGTSAPPPAQSPKTEEPIGPQPAAVLDVEQTNDAINQDISGLNDLADFPETELDDRSLGL